MAIPMPATLDEFKEHLGKSLDASVQDSELELTLEAATNAVEGWQRIGPICVRSFTDRVRVESGSLVLPKTPVQSVTSATRVPDGLQYVPADLDVDSVTGIVEALSGSIARGKYDVVYEAGRDPVPADLKEATLVIGKHLWESQRGPRAGRLRNEDENRAQWAGAGYLIPNRAAHLMQQYANVAVA